MQTNFGTYENSNLTVQSIIHQITVGYIILRILAEKSEANTKPSTADKPNKIEIAQAS